MQTTWVDLTYYELLVASFFFPVATFKCTLGPADEGVFLSLSATAVRALLNGDEKLQDGDTRHLPPDPNPSSSSLGWRSRWRGSNTGS